MSKRLQRKSILAVLIAMFLAFSIVGLATLFSNFNAAAADEEEEVPAVTYWLGEEGATKKDENGNDIIYSESMAGGWAAAVKAATEKYPALVKVKLLKNWEATSGSFGSTPTNPENHPECFNGGRITVPGGVNIVLDLAGFNLDRKLTAGVANGNVIYIAGGNLTVKDSSANQTGKITGGYNLGQTGGAMLVNTGSFVLKGGSITGNTLNGNGSAAYGGAIYLANGATFTMKNGTISDNHVIAGAKAVYGGAVIISKSTFIMDGGTIANNTVETTGKVYGGGVCLHTSGRFEMNGGVIEKHTADFGGGVCSYGSQTDEAGAKHIVIDGGIIRNNTATTTATSAPFGGGGIGLYGNGNLEIKSGEIYENYAVEWGGGVYIYSSLTSGKADVTFTMSGGSIHHNIVLGPVVSWGPVGGGLVIRNGSKANTDLTVTGTMTGGSIDANAIITTSPAINMEAWGAGAYLTNPLDFYLKGGEFTNNRAIYLSDQTKLEQVKETFFKGYDKVSGTEDDVEKAEYISDFNTYGGAISLSGTSHLYMSGGRIGEKADGSKAGNRAQQGGGIYLQGHLHMSGGIIANNKSHFGAGVRPINTTTAQSTTEFSGTPVIKDNIKWGRDGDLFTEATKTAPRVYWDEKENGSASNFEVNGSDGRNPDIGKLETGADIHISVTGTILANGQRFTQNYNTYNSETIKVEGTGKTQEVYYNPYNYFSSDKVYVGGNLTDQHIVVLYGGEYNDLAIAQYMAVFEVNYSDGTSEKYLFGKKFDKQITLGDNTFLYPESNYTSWGYGDTSKRPTSIKAYKLIEEGSADTSYTYKLEAIKDSDNPGQDAVAEIKEDAGIYTLQVKINTSESTSAYTSFSVLVQSRDLQDVETTDDENASKGMYIALSADNFKFTNEQKIPSSVTIKLDGILLVEHEDYELSYANNVNAGNRATVIITFKGNYSGEARAYFTISSAENYTADVTVAWEIYTGGGTDGWETFTDGQYDGTFTYNEADQGSKLRAKITVTDDGNVYTNTVYAKGYTASDDDLQNINVYLVFKVGGKETEFENVGEYSITIEGEFNYQIPTDINTIEGIVMAALELDLTNEALTNANYVDESDTRLWLLKIGSDEEVLYSNLLDKAMYIDPVDGEDNGFGEKITTGTTPDSYARFRDKQLSLIFNENYVIAGKPLSYWLARASYTITTNGTVDGTVLGAKDVVTTVTTVVTIIFGDNYAINGGNTVTITKVWKIVTISNTLRYASGTREEVDGNELPGWKFGVSSNVSYAFRPEHGDTVFYTYYLNGTFVDRFALVYSDDTADAIRQFYAVKVEDGKYVVDYEKSYNDPSYLSNFHYYTLRAGDYRLELYVPEREPYNEQHHHWWDGTTANDYGTMYYEFTYVFTFTVEQYDLVTEEGEINEGFSVVFPEDGFVYYTGEENNVVEPVITLNGITLVRGVDYELYSTSIEATNGEKSASLIIKGINSLKGQQFEWQQAFEIRQAFNGWVSVPSIMRWTYFGYLSEVHVLSGEANFGSVWFAIADADGNVIEGLDHITIDSEGHVIEEAVQTILKGLNAGYYKLSAHVTETSNYAGLAPDAIDFQVFKATNSWDTTPSVNAWIQGEYVSAKENLLVKPVFGEAHIKIIGADGKVYFNSDENIDNLAGAKHGNYTLIAWVDASDNFSELYEYRFDFEIFKQPGLPWWATLLIAVGALGVAALILFILWKKGVFQILTEKLFVAIKTRASVEATIASVRAAKMMEEGRQSVAEAKRRERIEKMRQKAQEEREMSPEERAAKLEAKAQADAARAEKLRARSEAAQRRAEKMRSKEASSAESPAETGKEADATDTPETPTEE